MDMSQMDPMVVAYLNRFAPPSWREEEQVPAPPPDVPAASTPPAPPTTSLMDYFQGIRPELFGQRAIQDAQAEDATTNRNRDMARSFAQAAGYFTGRGPDYTGLDPTQDAVRALGQRQTQALQGAEVGAKVAQFAQAQDAANPRSAASLFAYKAVMNDPYIGPRVKSMGAPGQVSAAQIAQITDLVTKGVEVGKGQATISKDLTQAGKTAAEAETENAMRGGRVEGQALGNRKTLVEIPEVQARTEKLAAETDALRDEKTKKPAAEERKTADDLRAQWLNQPDYKNAGVVADSYQKIKAAPPTGAGDVALLYGYMKILDPGSAVREGEIALGKATGSWPEEVRAALARRASGEAFTPEMRARFRESARLAYNAQVARYSQIRGEFARLATERGVDPRSVIIDAGINEDAGGTQPGGLVTLQPK